MEKELDVLEVKADALAANIMHRDGYIVRDDKGYTFTGAVLSGMIKAILETEEGEQVLGKAIKVLENGIKEIKDE